MNKTLKDIIISWRQKAEQIRKTGEVPSAELVDLCAEELDLWLCHQTNNPDPFQFNPTQIKDA